MFFTEKFFVGYSDVDKSLGLSNSSILKMFEDIATMHSVVAHDGLKDTPSRWFLTAYKVNITRRPEINEHITIKTWSTEIKGIQASREFEVYNENNELCITALSNWVRINSQTLRPERVTEEVAQAYGSESKTNFDDHWIEKLKEPESSDLEKEYFIDRNFIDANNHMNNVKYLDLAGNILPPEIYEAGEASCFTIMYKKAIPYAETVKCLYSSDDDGYTVTIKNQDGTDLHAVLKFTK